MIADKKSSTRFPSRCKCASGPRATRCDSNQSPSFSSAAEISSAFDSRTNTLSFPRRKASRQFPGSTKSHAGFCEGTATGASDVFTASAPASACNPVATA